MEIYDEVKPKICEFCLETCGNNFVVLKESGRKKLELLPLKLDVPTTGDAVICNSCTENINKCLEFKTVCSQTENYINFLKSEAGGNKLDLKEIYSMKSESTSITEDHIVCRLCLQVVKYDHCIFPRDSSSGITLEVFSRYFFEIDLDVTHDPAFCDSCHDSIRSYFAFMGRYVAEEINGQVCTLKHEDVNVKSDDGCSDFETEWNDVGSDLNENGVPKGNVSEEKGQNYTVSAYQAMYNAYLEQDMQNKQNTLEVEALQCTLCVFKADCQNSLDMHMMTHSKIKLFKCTVCGYESKYKWCFNKHMLIHKDSSEVEMYKCTMCLYKTRFKRYLKKHMLIHKDKSEIEMYKCTLCLYKTRLKGSLKKHMLIHKDRSEIEIYKCTMCSHETNHKRGLEYHMLNHKDPSEVEMYKCALCNYKTRHKHCVKRHMLIHKDSSEVEMYKCAMCLYKTRFKGSLKKHMLIHKDSSEIEMYKCTMCLYNTRFKGYLKKHMLIHKDSSEIEMYKCTLCTHETKLKSSLKRHMLTHTRTHQI